LKEGKIDAGQVKKLSELIEELAGVPPP